ncbi:MAG: M48 family metalloprotease [Betaproteobacteria bacterium]
MNTLFTRVSWTVIASVALAVAAPGAQTVITPPENKYTPAQDVELGRKAALEVEQQLPILHEADVTALVTSVGRRLVDAIPEELRHAEFRYSFQVVNVREINAFALPGGPMFVNRGMIEAATTEGEVAGVMAHELSHVALRHGTAQASKATKYEVGTLLGEVVGAIIGGRVGSVVSQGTQFGLGTAFLRFGREDERQADLLGSHIMARAGYDPLDMANMFKTIERQSGQGGPEWLSDHPDPGNRYEAITREAQMLAVRNPVHDTRAFTQAQARLRGMAPAPTTAEATRSAGGRSGSAPVPGGPLSGSPSGGIASPSSTYTAYTEGNLFRVSVPSNWLEQPGRNAVTFAPDGAYGNASGQGNFTHGMEIGVAPNSTRDLRTATDEFLSTLARSNPNLSRPSSYDRTVVGGRQGLHTVLSNGSNAAGQQEQLAVFTMLLEDGNLFYALGVAPRDRFSHYEDTFRRVVGSIEIMR